MQKLYELKEKLMDELNEYSDKEEMSAGDLEVVDKLTHTIKNLCKIIEDAEGYSEADSYETIGSYARGGRNRGGSYARGNRGGSYARGQERRNRYSSYSMLDRLQELADEAPDMRTRQEIERLMNRM